MAAKRRTDECLQAKIRLSNANQSQLRFVVVASDLPDPRMVFTVEAYDLNSEFLAGRERCLGDRIGEAKSEKLRCSAGDSGNVAFLPETVQNPDMEPRNHPWIPDSRDAAMMANPCLEFPRFIVVIPRAIPASENTGGSNIIARSAER